MNRKTSYFVSTFQNKVSSPGWIFVFSDGIEGVLCKLPVDGGVALPSVDIEHGLVGHWVEQGPEGGVAAPVVVGVEHGARLQPHRDNVLWLKARRGIEVTWVGLGDGVGVGIVILIFERLCKSDKFGS